jgi:hypothetical protein
MGSIRYDRFERCFADFPCLACGIYAPGVAEIGFVMFTTIFRFLAMGGKA